jgi:hypothetical protein
MMIWSSHLTREYLRYQPGGAVQANSYAEKGYSLHAKIEISELVALIIDN